MMKVFATSIYTEVALDYNNNSLIAYYSVEFNDASQLVNELKVIYPITLSDLVDISLICNYLTIFLSQMFLLQGEISLVCDEKDIQNYSDILKALYAIRNYEEGTSIQIPQINWVSHHNNVVFINTERPKVLNLVSGGKDSFVSDILLENNKAFIKRCFFSGLNIESSIYEKSACEYLYDSFDEIKLNGFDVLVKKLCEISNCYGQPPVNNFIPKGRDLLTIIFSYPLAVYYNCRYITHGCEKDLWEKVVVKESGEIPIHDSQCKLVMIPMSEQLLRVTGIHLFSPIAGMHEIYLFTWLMRNRPDSILKMQSCFFGEWCGKCSKCLRYYLIQKNMGLNIIRFKSNPELQLFSLGEKLNKPDAYETIGFYEELKFLTGEDKYKKELFTPTYCDLFPNFFERWKLK